MMAFIRVIALALVLASSSAWSSHRSESARDQYEAREDRPQPQLLTEATDHRPEVHMSHQTDFIKKSTNSSKQLTASDLQVGCGDGFIQEKLQDNSESDKNKVEKKTPPGFRRKRSYRPFSYQVEIVHPYQSISVWQPPVYQLSRPYFIPIYGAPGRIPIYYPPQPGYVNTGVPKDNPNKKPYVGPTYLPPREFTTKSSTTIEDRYKTDDEDKKQIFDGRPVWKLDDMDKEVPDQQRPTESSSSVIPTRKPQGGGPRPPLVHNPTDPEGFENVGRPEQSDRRTTTTTPRPRATQPPPQALPNDPSRCVWAIISCCSGNNLISNECFEQQGCPGPFWDSSPCERQFAEAAISATLNYYRDRK